MVELGAGRRLQQADHRRDDPALLDERDLLLEDGGGVAVEAHDKPTLNAEPGTLELLHVRQQIAAAVLALVTLGEAGVVGRLDADKDLGKPRLDHQTSVSASSSARLMETSVLKGIPRLSLPPLDERREEILFKDGLVADEVIVDEEDRPAATLGVERVEFGQDLPGGFSPGPVPERGR